MRQTVTGAPLLMPGMKIGWLSKRPMKTAARQQLVKLDPGQSDSCWWHQQQRENRCRHHEVTNDGTIRTCAV